MRGITCFFCDPNSSMPILRYSTDMHILIVLKICTIPVVISQVDISRESVFLKGEKGDRGLIGPKGEKGQKGDVGLTGVQGETGFTKNL